MRESSFRILQFVRFMFVLFFASSMLPSTFASTPLLEITSKIRRDVLGGLRSNNRQNRIIGISISNNTPSNISSGDESKKDWKFWKNLSTKRETPKVDDAKEGDDDDKNAKPEKKSPRKTRWGDVRKPSSRTSSDANSDKKNKVGKEDDNGGDDIVYGPSKKERKARKEEEKRKKVQEKEELQKEKEKNEQTKQLSLYEKKKASRQQKKKEEEVEEATKRRTKKDNDKGSDEEIKNDVVDTENVAADDDGVDADDPQNKNSTQPTQTEQEKNQTKPVENDSPERRKSTYVLLGSPSSYGGPPSSRPPQFRSPGGPATQQPSQSMTTSQAVAIAVVSVSNALSKILVAVWLVKRLHAEHEMKRPRQHFFWECLNDRYTRDEAILSRAIATPTIGFTKLKWGKYLKSRRDNGGKNKKTVPNKTVIVADLTPNGHLDVGYLTDIVSFLIGVQRRGLIGEEPEIVLLVQSPGGAAHTFGLAAAQVARLEQMGVNVTVCVDAVAASGGYMIASQASQIIAAPFAMVGSIGVFTEALNFNKLLTNYGVKPLVIKSGECKNTLSAIGPVTDDEIKSEKERSEEIHKAFIELCTKRRPGLDLSICNGSVLMGGVGKNHGLVDRVLTSSEYIWERICDGDHVMKLHRSNQHIDRTSIWSTVMNILPHLKHQFTRLPLGRLAQGYALLTMAHRTVRRHID